MYNIFCLRLLSYTRNPCCFFDACALQANSMIAGNKLLAIEMRIHEKQTLNRLIQVLHSCLRPSLVLFVLVCAFSTE